MLVMDAYKMVSATKHEAELNSNSHGKVRARMLNNPGSLISCVTLYYSHDQLYTDQTVWSYIIEIR